MSDKGNKKRSDALDASLLDKKMPISKRLGPDANGIVFVDRWEKDLFRHMTTVFGTMAECLSDNQPRDYHDKDATYVHLEKVVDSRTKAVSYKPTAFPKEADDYLAFMAAKEKAKRFYRNQSEWIEASTKMVTFME